MKDFEHRLLEALGHARGLEAANRLCEACVGVLDVDAAAVSIVFDGINVGTFGSSGPQARIYDEQQFTIGEGPCLDSVSDRWPVTVADLADPEERRWPAYGPAMIDHGIRGVYSVPVVVAGEYVGAQDVYRAVPDRLSSEQVAGMVAAAELAQLPLLDLLEGDLQTAVSDPDSNAWVELNSFSRTEVSQATGVLMAQLNIDAARALARLRAHAYATGRSASAVADDIIERRLRLEAD